MTINDALLDVSGCALSPIDFLTYEGELEEARLRLKNSLTSLLSEQDPKILLLFWINFCSSGVGMTEPVERWINRAGTHCKELGYTELGKQLCKHAIHEANHHLMMIADTKALINRWNSLYTPQLGSEVVLAMPYGNAVINYQKLHEDYIVGTRPYGQIAIEYEIENLSVTCGPDILRHTVLVLGEDISESLSFLDDHIKIDAAHTEFNRKVISNFIAEYPDVLDDLILAGKQALQCYGDFLNECYRNAVTQKL